MSVTFQAKEIINTKQSNLLYTVALSVLLLLIASKVHIPIGIVPITLQTFVVFFLGLQLDKRSAINTGITFVVIKLMTLPFWGCPSFGYIIGMGITLPAMSYMKQITHNQIISCIVGYLITNSFGCLWLHNFVSDWYLVWQCGIFPFILMEIFKAYTAICLSSFFKKTF